MSAAIEMDAKSKKTAKKATKSAAQLAAVGKLPRPNRAPLPTVNPVIVRPAQVCTMLGIRYNTLAQMVKDGRVPKPFPLNGEGGRAIAWLHETIVETAHKWAREAQEAKATPAE
jgi:predicted DNA-binding transcriptional regulator AlpA